MNKKTIITGLIGLCVVGALFGEHKKDVESIKISIPDYQNEYDINTDIPIEIEVTPGDANTDDLRYRASSTYIDFSKEGINTGKREGTYEIYIKTGDVQSNTLSITVVDMATRAKEAELRQQEEQKLAEEQAAKEAEENRLAQEEQQRLAEESERQRAADEQNPQTLEPQDSEDTSNPSSNSSNFNTYDNPEQQQTSASYVLNTSSGKFHYPSCKSVKTIAPQNYATSNSSRDDLIAQGYQPCGNCHP